MFWVDEIVEDIIKKYPEKDSFLITDWWTPSGHAHFGGLRGPLIHDIIRRGLSEKKKKAIFKFGIDDFDPMDGLPVYVDKSFSKYMGIPLNKIPAPDGKNKSFAEQYTNEFKNILQSLGGEIEFVSVYEAYKAGKYNESIKLILDHTKEIRSIYKEISGSEKGEDWYPFQVVCPNCGKIGTTIVTDWDGDEVEFTCREDLVEWAKGCNFKGKLSPFDGNGKLLWRVEWPSKWFVFGSEVEGEGKDHFAAGGSRDVADRIFRDIFKKTPPYDIRYEHLLIGGAKMSSSKGLGVTAQNMFDLLPANILRFLFARTKIKRALEFNPDGETISLLYDEYDRCLLDFQSDHKLDTSRAFYFSEIDPKKEQPKYLLRFSKIAYMLQMPRVDIFEYAKQEKASEAKSLEAEGEVGGAALSDIEKKEIESRIEIAKKWLKKFAPDSYRFTVQQELPEVAKKLTRSQQEFMEKILNIFQSKEKWTGEDLHKQIHNIKNSMEINPRDAFSAIYLTFIGKDSGPQAGWLLASLEREFVIKRLKEATDA